MSRLSKKFNKCALIIVDIQAEFCDPAGSRGNAQTDRIAKRIAQLAPEFRKANIPIYAVYFAERGVPAHQAGFYKYTPEKGDIPVSKQTDSAFNTGYLSIYLEQKGINKLYICGVNFNACVKDTAISATKKGYDVSLLTNLCANDNGERNQDRDLKKGAKAAMKSHGIKFIHSQKLLIKPPPHKPS